MNKEKLSLKYHLSKLIANTGVDLIYAVKFGSHLYGTDTPESDLDIKGIFLPPLNSLITGNPITRLAESTGDNRSRNTKDDVDIELFSIHKWFSDLTKGDTHALDLLFSPSHEDCVIFKDYRFELIFKQAIQLVNFEAAYSRVYEYAFGQAKKYGIKGSRMGVLKRLDSWLTANRLVIGDAVLKTKRLRDYIDQILDQFEDESYCFAKEINNINSLVVCGRVHQGTISILEFAERIHGQYETYGERARLAEQNQGIDWKACSHALRAAQQIKQLLTEGKITFPLADSDLILKVKRGELPWEDTEKVVIAELENLAELKANTRFADKYEPGLDEEIILQLYNR